MASSRARPRSSGTANGRPVATGDLIFVPALVPHRFVDIGPDFDTWVVFFGTPQQAP